jgi:hypothetical protein
VIGEKNAYNILFIHTFRKSYEKIHLDDTIYMGGYFKMDLKNCNGMIWI